MCVESVLIEYFSLFVRSKLSTAANMSVKLGRLKEKLSSMQADIDDTNAACKNLQSEIDEETRRADEAQARIRHLNKTINLLEDDKSDVEEKLRELKMRTDVKESEADESGRCNKVMESRAGANADRISALEAEILQQTKDIERLEISNSELKEKLQDTEEKLEDAEERQVQLKSSLNTDLAEVDLLTNNHQSLNVLDKKMSEGEEKKQREIEQLNEQLEETLQRASEAESKTLTLQNCISSLEDEIEDTKKRTRDCETEMNDMDLALGEM